MLFYFFKIERIGRLFKKSNGTKNPFALFQKKHKVKINEGFNLFTRKYRNSIDRFPSFQIKEFKSVKKLRFTI